MNQPNASENEWREQLLFHSGTVIGEIVEEILSEPKDAIQPHIHEETQSYQSIPAQLKIESTKKQEGTKSRRWKRCGKLAIIIGGSALLIAAALIVALILLKDGKKVEAEVAEDTAGEQVEESTTTAADDETPSIPGATGTVFYVKRGDIYAYDVAGNEHRTILKIGNVERIEASPLGDRIVFYKEGDSIPWVTNIDGTGIRRLLDETALLVDQAGEVGAGGLCWSNDGGKIFFGTGGGSSGAMIYQANSDGTGVNRFNRVSDPVFAFSTWGGPAVYFTREPTNYTGDWDYRLEYVDTSGNKTWIEAYMAWNDFWLSHDGSRLAIVEGDYDKKQNLRIYYVDSVRSIMLNELYDFSIEATWSPDDKFLAICSGEEQRRSLQIYDIESGKLTTILSNEDCWSPSWAR